MLALHFTATDGGVDAGGVVLAAGAPVPLKATGATEFEALLTSVRLPLTAPEAVGVNFTENEAL